MVKEHIWDEYSEDQLADFRRGNDTTYLMSAKLSGGKWFHVNVQAGEMISNRLHKDCGMRELVRRWEHVSA